MGGTGLRDAPAPVATTAEHLQLREVAVHHGTTDRVARGDGGPQPAAVRVPPVVEEAACLELHQ
ncbi:hypothetical protein GCM10009557_79260 [Virgisporangium ochraceum]